MWKKVQPEHTYSSHWLSGTQPGAARAQQRNLSQLYMTLTLSDNPLGPTARDKIQDQCQCEMAVRNRTTCVKLFQRQQYIRHKKTRFPQWEICAHCASVLLIWLRGYRYGEKHPCLELNCVLQTFGQHGTSRIYNMLSCCPIFFFFMSFKVCCFKVWSPPMSS